jgi:hypothetical protein
MPFVLFRNSHVGFLKMLEYCQLEKKFAPENWPIGHWQVDKSLVINIVM